MRLSVIMPVFNEAKTFTEIISRVRSLPLSHELVLVDDFSSDGSREMLDAMATDPDVQVLHHKINRGKGVAVATGLRVATGDVAVIQDADLEYNPQDFVQMLEPIAAGKAQVVYGVRDLSSQKPIMRFGNRLMSAITNLLYGAKLEDMETCYKMMTREVFQNLDLECKRFDVEAEITAKILRRGYSIQEIPIQYTARYEDKKLSPADGWPTLRALLKYRRFK